MRENYSAFVPEQFAALMGERLFADKTAQLHLIDPSTPALELSQKAGVSLNSVVEMYREMQTSDSIQAVVLSPFYPRRLMTMDARATVADWLNDPSYAQKVLKDESVSPRNLEVHATKGVCNQGCTMCLWSDKQEKTYTTLDLKGNGLMTSEQWIQSIGEAKENGTKRIVFSGGGEPLLNNGLFKIIGAANEMSLATHLYSNGFSMDKLPEEAKREMLQMEQIRFSVHSPDANTYNEIVKMSPKLGALDRVKANIANLLDRRERENGKVKVGIGFVTQPINYTQIEMMAEFASRLDIDFLNIRQDEVSVTEGLTAEQRDHVSEQLRRVRERTIKGDYGITNIDMSDDLTAMANGVELTERKVATCHMKQFRPAISPYGVVGACDLMVEPNFANKGNTFGDARTSLPIIFERASTQSVKADCAECMPSGRAGNAMLTKLKQDYKVGINYTDQPFNF